MSLYQIGGATYVQSGTPASAEANCAWNPSAGIIGGNDPSLWRVTCPLDSLPCRVIGSQVNNFRCDQNHTWSIGSNGALSYVPYVLDSKLSPVVPMYIPPTFG
jgi:hypothetical protein